MDDTDLAIVLETFGLNAWQWQYDALGRVVAAQSCNGQYQCEYDALGRRIWQSRTTSGSGGPTTETTFFLYGPGFEIELDEEGGVKAETAFGLLGPIARWPGPGLQGGGDGSARLKRRRSLHYKRLDRLEIHIVQTLEPYTTASNVRFRKSGLVRLCQHPAVYHSAAIERNIVLVARKTHREPFAFSSRLVLVLIGPVTDHSVAHVRFQLRRQFSYQAVQGGDFALAGLFLVLRYIAPAFRQRSCLSWPIMAKALDFCALARA